MLSLEEYKAMFENIKEEIFKRIIGRNEEHRQKNSRRTAVQ